MNRTLKAALLILAAVVAFAVYGIYWFDRPHSKR